MYIHSFIHENIEMQHTKLKIYPLLQAMNNKNRADKSKSSWFNLKKIIRYIEHIDVKEYAYICAHVFILCY